MTLLNYTDPIPFPAPVTTGTTIQSYTDPLGDVWVAKNGVRSGRWMRARDVLGARAYPTANLAVAVSANTTITLNGISYDLMGMVVAANNSITVPIAGRYSIVGNICLSAAPATVGQQQTVLAVNTTGTVYGAVSYFGAAQATWPGATAADIPSLNAGDAIQLLCWMGSTAGTAMGNAARTFLAVQYLGTG